jgi:hypothetical protein
MPYKFVMPATISSRPDFSKFLDFFLPLDEDGIQHGKRGKYSPKSFLWFQAQRLAMMSSSLLVGDLTTPGP